jgi:hypothetical protein
MRFHRMTLAQRNRCSSHRPAAVVLAEPAVLGPAVVVALVVQRGPVAALAEPPSPVVARAAAVRRPALAAVAVRQ